jgi:hypothetical protein
LTVRSAPRIIPSVTPSAPLPPKKPMAPVRHRTGDGRSTLAAVMLAVCGARTPDPAAVVLFTAGSLIHWAEGLRTDRSGGRLRCTRSSPGRTARWVSGR